MKLHDMANPPPPPNLASMQDSVLGFVFLMCLYLMKIYDLRVAILSLE